MTIDFAAFYPELIRETRATPLREFVPPHREVSVAVPQLHFTTEVVVMLPPMDGVWYDH